LVPSVCVVDYHHLSIYTIVIMKKFYLRFILLSLLCVLCAPMAWGQGYAAVKVYSDPQDDGGYVYASTSNSSPSYNKTSDDAKSSYVTVGTKSFTFYLYEKAKVNYVFRGWAQSNTSSTVLSSNNPYSTSFKSGYMSTNTQIYYALFSRLTADKSSLNFGNVVVGQSSSAQTIVITHAHADKITATVSGANSGDFVVSNSTPVSNSTTKGTATITVTFKPQCNGTRSAKLVLKSSYSGLSNVEIPLSGTGTQLSQSLSWNNESNINTNMMVGATQTVSASSTSGLSVSYSSSNTSVLTVDASGKLTAVAAGSATITASQSGDCTYSAAVDISKTFTISAKQTPLFNPDGFSDGSTCNLKVGDTRTMEVSNVSDGLAGNFTATASNGSIIGITRAGNVITIEALNAGSSTATFKQTETSTIYAAQKQYAFSVTKHANTLAVANTSLTKLVEEEVENFVSGINSDAAVTTTSTTPQVATYDIANNKIIAHAAGTTTITISQAATYKYEGTTKTINVTVNKHTPAFTWNESNVPYTCNSTIGNVLTLTNGDPARITYVSDNEAIAEVVAGTLIIHNVLGTANITVTHQATDYWATRSEVYVITPVRVDRHVPFDITASNYNAFKQSISGAFAWDNGLRLGDPTWGGANYNDKTYVLSFVGIPDKLSFNFAAADAAIGVEWYVAESTNGSSWSTIWNSTGLVGRIELQLNPETRYLKLCYSGNWSGIFSNVHVSELSKFVSDVQTVDFGVVEKGAVAPAQSFTISYANAGYQINTSLPAGSPFSVSPALTNSISGERYGTQVVNVNLNTSSIGQFNHTLEYTDGVHEPVLVNLHAKIVTYFEADIRANYPNARVHSGIDVADAYLFSATSASTPSADSSADFYFELQDNTNSSGQQILSYNPTTNTITTLHEGIARIVFHQKETGLYRAVAREFTIFVSNQDEDVCELKNVPTEKNLNSSSEPYTVSWTEEDAAEAVTFDAKRSLFASHVLVEQFYDGAWHSLSSLSDDQLYSYSTFTRELNRRATAVRFSQNGATDNYVRNVVVTRKNYLETTPSAVYMPRFIVGDASPSTATVEVKWSNSAGQQLSVSCSDPNITVSPATISMPDCHNGTATVTLSFAPSTPMNISASLIIGDIYKISVIPVIASATGIPVFEGTDPANPLDWFDDANWSTGSVPSVEDIVIVNAPVYLSNQVVPTVVRGVTIADGGSIIIQPTAGMSIGDRGMTGANSSNLLLEANEDGQTGYLRISPDYHGAMPEASVQMRVSGYASADDANAVWQYLGSPVTAASSKVVTTLLKGAWAYGWDETMASGSTWLFVDPYDNLRQFSGYAITCNQAGGRTYTHTGTINAPETRVINLTYTQANYDSRGFNLLANSWTAPVDATKFRVSDFVNCDATLYMFVSGSWNDFTNADNKMGSSRGQYLSIPVGSAAQMAGLTYKEIPSMQGFFVQANDADASIKMDYTRLIWNVDYTGKATPAMHAPQRATTADDLTARLELTVSGNGFADRVYMLETDYYSPEYENGYDARKQIGSDAVPNMFVSSQDGKLTVCATDQLVGSLLGFYAPASDADTLMLFTLRADNVIGEDLYLYDLQEQTYTLLSEGAEYTFTSQAGVQNDLRFQIVSAQDVPGAGAPTDIDDLESSVSLWNSGNLIFVSGANVADTFRLYNAEGKLLDACAFSSAMSYDASHLTSGVYVAMVGKQVLKIVK